eukprot:CAMPEP_0201603746 /NCGR_PEP_ID=MMETSP0492-20130828/4102_1 /ASSEMBLY_ACC=CAM_ASM_000837 /TAXON_ID=420259 /ORGANISM="Thalassiosira gravida, Strain GMp14c1" /LENGTH=69 /DNA_ID=CAMNT_0048067599 /DNA_START=343 /DNA_END=552 /DNA_ORIENTATION=+
MGTEHCTRAVLHFNVLDVKIQFGYTGAQNLTQNGKRHSIDIRAGKHVVKSNKFIPREIILTLMANRKKS